MKMLHSSVCLPLAILRETLPIQLLSPMTESTELHRLKSAPVEEQ